MDVNKSETVGAERQKRGGAVEGIARTGAGRTNRKTFELQSREKLA